MTPACRPPARRSRRRTPNADHLADFGHRWIEPVKKQQRQRWSQVLGHTLLAHLSAEALDYVALTWLFRELRAAELSGRDGAGVLAEAKMRPLTGIRDVARVLHGRVRILTRDAQVQTGRTWAERLPDMADLHAIASALDHNGR